jgi:serine phosphatase RsbU (regulator of sigma subunit)
MPDKQIADLEYFKKKEHYLEVINQFATSLLKAKSIDDVVWTVAKNAIAQLGYVDCVIYLKEENSDYLIQRAAHGPKNPIALDILNPIKIKIGEGIVGHVAKTQKGEIVSDTTKDSRYILDDNIRLSEIAVPIVFENQTIGVIDSEHPDKNFYPEDDLNILVTIASMTATKIMQAKYDEKLQQYQYDLKELVHLKTLELNRTLSELKEQKLELTDSIKYAKRIQKAVFKSPIDLQKILPESFFLYKPKDIIAGDFYWVECIEHYILFAVADCTGHGVPGAIVSVVCHNAMKRAIRRTTSTNPAVILDKTRELVIESFDGSDEEIKDGMDVALCVYNTQTRELNYAGANINLHYLHNQKLKIIKANKQPIGQYPNQVPFVNHKVKLEPGDCIYLFTDGISDQFGGPKGKKYKYKRVRDLISEVAHLSLPLQYDNIQQEFINWKGNLQQVDDVCMVGIKF